MPAPVTKEHRIYLALWRKAYLEKDIEPLRIKCSSIKMALHHRLGLYRVIRPYRTGEAVDTILCDAAEKLVPSITPKDEPEIAIVFRPRKTLADLEAAIEDLGISDLDLLTPEERLLADEVEELASTKPIPRSNPFYER
jgi:hypothetical protein